MKDGGPAFPVQNDPRPGSYEAAPGMSLLDYFAGQFALAATIEGLKGNGHFCPTVAQRTASHAYEMAAAMLAQRERIMGEGK